MLRIPCFYYHSIGNIGPETLSANIFREHLSELHRRGFQTLTFSELLNEQLDPAKNYAVLSFDDGLIDNYDNAFPILQEFGFKATFFIIADFDNVVRWVNPNTRAWSDDKRDGFTIAFPSMQKHHRAELLNHGMEIGSHSLSHRKLNTLSQKELKAEIFDSKSKLEDQHGVGISTFCYPKGRYNNAVVRLLENAGYQGACTTMPSYYGNGTDRFECGRFLVENSRLFSIVLKYAGAGHRGIDCALGALGRFLKVKNVYF